MSEQWAGDPPQPAGAESPCEFIEKLRELRLWAGEPSLRRLRQLAGSTVDNDGRTIDALPVSTTSHVLRGDRLPRMEFVRAFVVACLRARGWDLGTVTETMESWHEAWLRLHRPVPAQSRAVPAPAHVPRQLPLDVAGFTGRGAELADLREALAAAQRHGPIVISAIDGMAGIGKTALALHAAHQLAGRYPDGQLFIDLHGFTEAVAPVDPGDALDRLLRALGVAGERIPAELDDRAALWRSMLADRRMLIVLDNAASEEQVAPLLPGAPACLVLITSRRRMLCLLATHTVSLETLPVADAVALFIAAAGEQRLANEPPELLAEAVDLCGRLPLAIRIAAGRLRSRPSWRLADLVARLQDHDHRLAELAARSRSVTAALDVSYQQLTADQRHLYRLLGLHPGPNIEPYAAAALADTTANHARQLLDELLDANLLQEPAAGRYTLHDLVRAHAVTAAGDEPERRAALGRQLDHFRDTALAATEIAYPYERDRRRITPPAGRPGPELPDEATAIAWLDSELASILAAATYAADSWPEHTRHLSALLHTHLRARGRYRDARLLHELALSSARAAGDRAGELTALIDLGQICHRQGHYRQATDRYSRAMQLAHATGDHTRELDARHGLGEVYLMQGEYDLAVHQLAQVLDIARDTADSSRQIDALHGLAHIDMLQGRHKQATDRYAQMLEIARAMGDRANEVAAWQGLGEVHLLQGRTEQALVDFARGLRIARPAGHWIGELGALRGLGRVHLQQGSHEQALDHYARALEIARTTGHRTGEIDALIGLGHVHRRLSRHRQAAGHYQRALAAAREMSDRNLQFEALHGLGRLHCASGEPDQATAVQQQALQLATDLRQPADQARAHDGLAHAYHALHQDEHARQHWQAALDLLTTLGTDHTEDGEASASTIRSRLTGLRG